MDSSLKQSNSFGRLSSVDVSQLDKVNAIPNKSTDNALMDGLCQEDQIYLSTLMENDSSENDDDDANLRRSAWSPMARSPIIMNKRIKRLRPAHAVTLSLEDISYIRPSWGISKGVRTIEIDKPKKRKPEVDERKVQKDKSEKGSNSNERVYYYFLLLLWIAVLLLTVPTYIIDNRREYLRVIANRIQVFQKSRLIEFYKPVSDELNPILKMRFAKGIPKDLKSDVFPCDIFDSVTQKEGGDGSKSQVGKSETCVTSIDWPLRANLRIYVTKDQDWNSFCYDFKWQSYDSLNTPLVDCFTVGDEQWFGLGDILISRWPLNKIQPMKRMTLHTNLSAEFPWTLKETDSLDSTLVAGSYVNLSLFSTNGIHVGQLRSDFNVELEVTQDEDSNGAKMICLAAVCNEMCGKLWTRASQYDRFRMSNNFLEYRICTSDTLMSQIHRQVDKMSGSLDFDEADDEVSPEVSTKLNQSGLVVDQSKPLAKMIETEAKVERLLYDHTKTEPVAVTSTSGARDATVKLPEGVGLIERTIFVTSVEFMASLDGQTLRLYVDNIVKLGLKSSSILLIDSRWESHVGSLKLNTALFPKSKLLFEILHNKGFKIIFTIKPYVDTSVGSIRIKQLLNSNRLYGTSYSMDQNDHLPSKRYNFSALSNTTTILRRKSLFGYENTSIAIEKNDIPFRFACKESEEKSCALIDLSQAQNRAWMLDNIRRSSLLTKEADGILLGGTHPRGLQWDDHLRAGVSQLIKDLFYSELIYTIPQWTGDFSYIQLAPRAFTWDSLRSVLGSVLNLSSMGFSLVHPGSVWGDIRGDTNSSSEAFRIPNKMDSIYGDVQSGLESEKELAARWLQLSIFMPILQFNNIAPIERFNLQEQLQNLVKVRKAHIVPELKKNIPYTPLVASSVASQARRPTQSPLIQPIWLGQAAGEIMVEDQFTVGPDIVVAPVLTEGLRQRDIYLPSGFWHDELRQVNIRGGKWLRNYPVELNEIAWFTRTRR